MKSIQQRSIQVRRKLNRIRAGLRSGSARGRQANESDCEDIRLLLPACAEAELGGWSLPELELVEAHLQHCQDCAVEYWWLVKLSLLDEQGRLPEPGQYPDLDTTFLPMNGTVQ